MTPDSRFPPSGGLQSTVSWRSPNSGRYTFSTGHEIFAQGQLPGIPPGGQTVVGVHCSAGSGSHDGSMRNASALDAPPGDGLTTVTCAVPCDPRSLHGIAAFTAVLPRTVVERSVPFHRTTAPAAN